MIEKELLNKLIRVSNEVSNEYSGLHFSQLYHPIPELIEVYKRGDADKDVLKRAMSQRCEQALLERVLQINQKFTLMQTTLSINPYIKTKGHFWYDTQPGLCKSVTHNKQVPTHIAKIPKYIYWWLQAMMLATNQGQSWVIFESRESGLMRVFFVKRNLDITSAIEKKAVLIEEVLSAEEIITESVGIVQNY